MFNRVDRAILLALVSLSLLWSQPVAHASGTIPLSMTQQLDQYGVPLSGCQLYIIQAGTTSTPQNAFKDTALTTPQPNPMNCDAAGRLPQFFLADGQIKIRLLDKLGNPQVVLDNILVIGPTSGGGSGATIDPTTIAATGDLKHAYGAQVVTGWVRLAGRTIGNAASGATERANADTQALFLYLWGADPNLAVSGGRTTAAADYAANKTITLPDARGRALSGLGDMGNTDAARLTSSYFGASGTLLGATGGGESFALTLATLPGGINSSAVNTVNSSGVNTINSSGSNTINSSGSNTISVVSNVSSIPSNLTGSAQMSSASLTANNAPVTPGAVVVGAITSTNPTQAISVTATPTISVSATPTISVTASPTISVASNNTGGLPHRTVPPIILVTIYIKL